MGVVEGVSPAEATASPRHLEWVGAIYVDWDLLGSLYIIPFVVEQKIEACCFGLVSPC